MIRMSELSLRLGGRLILDEVSLWVKPGETVALLGASGSGKSLLLRCAVGLLRPDSGRVTLFDTEVTRASASALREARRRVGMLFQANALFDSMTVAGNIGFTLREVLGLAQDRIEQKVDELLERLRLGPVGAMYPAELSGGMKKRVGIARAIAHDPEALICDDPTAGLDPITSDVITDLIAELAQTPGRATLLATNYPPLVDRVADRVLLLEAGRVTDLGPPQALESRRPGMPGRWSRDFDCHD